MTTTGSVVATGVGHLTFGEHTSINMVKAVTAFATLMFKCSSTSGSVNCTGGPFFGRGEES